MSILYDCHMHSAFSADSDTPAELQIKRAIALGLKGICFTEHEDPDYPPDEGLDFHLDMPAYFRELTALRQQYADELQICIGMEFGIQPHLPALLDSLSQQWPFDFIIASQHILNGKDPYYPQYFEGRSEKECYFEFFRAQYETLRQLPLYSYNTLGHMDYILRYGPTKNTNFSLAAYNDVIELLLRYLIENGKCLEVNTGGFKAGLGQTNPGTEILKRYRELGGELLTIGADAHTPDYVGYEFSRTSEMLLDLGFRYYMVFQNRIGHPVKL